MLMDILLNIIAFYGKMVGFIATNICERLNDPMTNRYEQDHERRIFTVIMLVIYMYYTLHIGQKPADLDLQHFQTGPRLSMVGLI